MCLSGCCCPSAQISKGTPQCRQRPQDNPPGWRSVFEIEDFRRSSRPLPSPAKRRAVGADECNEAAIS
ncbi:hypothetical protein AEQ63_02360 [Pseudomonas sp. RIT-PI-o]|nr:hypothetical protein AEQ63_02360 [Pseudomonas sp. RIT-PI-o]